MKDEYDEYDINVLFPSNYVSALDLQKPVDIRITRIKKEKVPMTTRSGRNLGPEEKIVAEFKGTKKCWIINKTNAYAIAALFGGSLKNAQGKSVTLVSDPDFFGSQAVDAIRVRGSIEVDPEIQKDIDWAWDGDRTRGKYLGRLKIIVEKHRQRQRGDNPKEAT